MHEEISLCRFKWVHAQESEVLQILLQCVGAIVIPVNGHSRGSALVSHVDNCPAITDLPVVPDQCLFDSSVTCSVY